MNHTLIGRIVSLGLIVGAGAFAACGGSSDDPAPASTGTAGSTSGGSGGSTAGKGGTTSGGTGGTVSGGAGGSDAGAGGTTSGGAGGGSCANPSVDVDYDLTGSTFEITDTPLGAGNQVNTLQTPYTDAKNIGPGTMTIRFAAPAGQPAAGRMDVIKYDMVLEFTVNAAGTNVHTDLTVDVKPATCSGAQGALAGAMGTWMDPGLDPYHTKGNVTCMGATCSLGGLPNGMPVPRDTTEKLKLNPFTFTNGTSDFTMPKVLVSSDSKSKTWLSLKGKAVGAPKPSCGCN